MANTYVNTENLRVSEGDGITSEIINRALENTDANHEELGNEKILINAYTYDNGNLRRTKKEFEPSDLSNRNLYKRCKVEVTIPYQKSVTLPFYEFKYNNPEYDNKTTYAFRNGVDELIYVNNGTEWEAQYRDVGQHRHNIQMNFANADQVYFTICNNSNVAINVNTIDNYLSNFKSATGVYHRDTAVVPVIAIKKSDNSDKYLLKLIDGEVETYWIGTMSDNVE